MNEEITDEERKNAYEALNYYRQKIKLEKESTFCKDILISELIKARHLLVVQEMITIKQAKTIMNKIKKMINECY